MSSVIWHITMSLDGFIAGPDDSMDWAVRQWSEDGADTRAIEVDRSAMPDELLRSAGAILGGRRWYDVAPRLYDGVEGSTGWVARPGVRAHPLDAGSGGARNRDVPVDADR